MSMLFDEMSTFVKWMHIPRIAVHKFLCAAIFKKHKQIKFPLRKLWLVLNFFGHFIRNIKHVGWATCARLTCCLFFRVRISNVFRGNIWAPEFKHINLKWLLPSGDLTASRVKCVFNLMALQTKFECCTEKTERERENENRTNSSANAFYIHSKYIRKWHYDGSMQTRARNGEREGANKFIPEKANASTIFETLKQSHKTFEFNNPIRTKKALQIGLNWYETLWNQDVFRDTLKFHIGANLQGRSYDFFVLWVERVGLVVLVFVPLINFCSTLAILSAFVLSLS